MKGLMINSLNEMAQTRYLAGALVVGGGKRLHAAETVEILSFLRLARFCVVDEDTTPIHLSLVLICSSVVEHLCLSSPSS